MPSNRPNQALASAKRTIINIRTRLRKISQPKQPPTPRKLPPEIILRIIDLRLAADYEAYKSKVDFSFRTSAVTLAALSPAIYAHVLRRTKNCLEKLKLKAGEAYDMKEEIMAAHRYPTGCGGCEDCHRVMDRAKHIDALEFRMWMTLWKVRAVGWETGWGKREVVELREMRDVMASMEMSGKEEETEQMKIDLLVEAMEGMKLG